MSVKALSSHLKGELALGSDFSTLDLCAIIPAPAPASPHRGLLRVPCASCQSECHSAPSLADEVRTMENKVGARGAS